jgi:hypothetical protein
MTDNQQTALAFLKRRPDAWFAPAAVNRAYLDRRVTAGGCARNLQSLVAMGLAEVRENGRYPSGFPRKEYRAVA